MTPPLVVKNMFLTMTKHPKLSMTTHKIINVRDEGVTASTFFCNLIIKKAITFIK